MNGFSEIEFDKIFERLKKAKHGVVVDFVKPAVFAMDEDKWRVYAFGSVIKTDDGWVCCHRFLRFMNNPNHYYCDNMIPETAIEFAKLQGDKATIKFKRGNTEYKVQMDLSEHK